MDNLDEWGDQLEEVASKVTPRELLQLARLYGIQIEKTPLGVIFLRKDDYCWDGSIWINIHTWFIRNVQPVELGKDDIPAPVLNSLYNWLALGSPWPKTKL